MRPAAPLRGVRFCPHRHPVYAAERGIKARLSWWDLTACVELPLGPDGAPVIPPDALSEDTAVAPPVAPVAPVVSARAEAADDAPVVDELSALEEEMRREMALPPRE